EAASANLASPIDIPFDHLATRARGFNPRERSWNFTNPWPGGRWTLRDIVSYQTDAAYALLESAARYRDIWLANFLTVEERGVHGWRGWPYAYVIPRQQRDTGGLATLLGILHRGQVQIRTALHPVTLAGQRYAAGSYVVVLRQPYAAFAKTLLEPQHYPDLRLYPGGPPVPPYDVTAHTLPLLMGVAAVPARDSLRIGLSTPIEPPAATPGSAGVAGADGPRVGLYRSYDAAIDEGWTRWVFDTWRVPYVSVVDSEVRAGKLAERFDVVVRTEQSPDELRAGLAFEVLDSSAARVIGRYPADADKVLLSGWVLHPERVAGRAALVEVKRGAGRVVLFGFRPQYRGQSIATYPLLFNSLQVSAR